MDSISDSTTQPHFLQWWKGDNGNYTKISGKIKYDNDVYKFLPPYGHEIDFTTYVFSPLLAVPTTHTHEHIYMNMNAHVHIQTHIYMQENLRK